MGKLFWAFGLAFLTVTSVFCQMAGMPNVTFTKDVAPILQRECQNCHRPGEAGPFSMLTYESTRPWAAAMKEAVKTRKMPPWFADPHYGKFTNGRTLSDGEIKTIS